MASIMFQSAAARAAIDGWYDRFLARVPAQSEARVVPTRFGETHVRVAGPAEAPPIVLLHGALASSAHALAEMGPLLDRFRVFAVDVIGQSVKSADARIALDGPDYATWVGEVMDALGLARAHLYGVSWGGFVALRAATVAPARVDRLVLMVPAGFVGGPVWAGLTQVGLPMAMYRAFPSEARLARVVRPIFTTVEPQWTAYFGDAVRSYRLDMRIPPLATPDQLRGFDRPALVFGAELDLSFPGAALLARVKELIPHAETELIAGSRHSPPFDDAFRARTADRITAFLR